MGGMGIRKRKQKLQSDLIRRQAQMEEENPRLQAALASADQEIASLHLQIAAASMPGAELAPPHTLGEPLTAVARGHNMEQR